MLSDAYLTAYAAALGRLLANLAALERSLRSVLYAIGHPPHVPLPDGVSLLTMRPGDVVPLNALTSWDTLGQLIDAFNAAHVARQPPFRVDPTLKTLRDAFAHGRLVADAASTHFVLMRFRRPVHGTVTVEDRCHLTLDWMDAQIGRSGDAVDVVTRRLRELYPNG